MLLPRFFAVAILLASSNAFAEAASTVPAGGGLPALAVRVDLATGTVVAGDLRLPIALDHSQLPAEQDVIVEAVAIGAGRSVAHVRVPTKQGDGTAWEALLAGGKSEPIFAGVTGFALGDPGERSGKAVRVLHAGSEARGKSFVVVGDVREDLRICGQEATILDPEALYPASLELRPATVQRLDPDRQARAQPIVAVDKGSQAEPALARLLVARGSSVSGSRGVELTDGQTSTVWSEARPGIGQGEFVVMAAPKDVPITRMQIVLSPPSPDPDGAAPKSFYLVTGTETFLVTLPGDAWLKPGEAYEIEFSKPIEASCVSLVLSDAYTRDRPHPQVSVAELAAYSEFDGHGATLDDVAKQLSGPRGLAAAQLLERADPGALAAVERAYGALDARGRAHAIDVAASHDPCQDSAALLARGLCEDAGEAPRKAREKLERCKGAADVLAAKLRADASSRTCVAPTLADLAGPAALEPIADAMAATSTDDVATRAVLREAFSRALREADAGRLAGLLGDTKRGPQARLEMMRAAGGRVAEARAESGATLNEIFTRQPTMRDRYVALGPLAELARAGDGAAAARISQMLAGDADGPVRARAAEVANGLSDVKMALLSAARDPEPRVREAALQSMSKEGTPDAIRVATEALSSDRWSFVKVQAIGLLARARPASDIDGALGGALKDASPRVRGAATVALGFRRAGAMRKAIRERLDDEQEDVDVRSVAARVLGALCDADSVDRLTQLARKLGVTGTTEDEQQIAIGALEGLAAMQPRDLADRLAPLQKETVPPSARSAARRALTARGVCR